MPNRRKSKAELAEELLGSASGSDTESGFGGPTPDAGAADGDTDGTFQAFEPDVGADVNALFRFLHEHGWMTTGAYSLTGSGEPDSPTVISFSVVLDDALPTPTPPTNEADDVDGDPDG